MRSSNNQESWQQEPGVAPREWERKPAKHLRPQPTKKHRMAGTQPWGSAGCCNSARPRSHTHVCSVLQSPATGGMH